MLIEDFLFNNRCMLPFFSNREIACVCFIKMKCVNISRIDSAVNKEADVAFMTCFMFMMCSCGLAVD